MGLISRFWAKAAQSNRRNPLTTTVLMVHPGAELYGADRMMLESVRAAVDQGWNVVVSVPTLGPLVNEMVDLGANVQITTSLVVRKSYLHGFGPLRLIPTAAKAFWAGLEELRRVRPDAIYVSTITLPLWPLIGFLARIPVICHVHEAETSAAPILRRVLLAPLWFAKTIIANSKYSARFVSDNWKKLSSRQTVIYNGVVGPPNLVLPRRSIDGPIRLLFLGRLSERKGASDALYAAAAVRNHQVPVELVLLGDIYPGYEGYKEQLEAQIRALDLENEVTLAGFQHNIWPFLARCDIVLIPSRLAESFGNTAVEGVLAARPVLASNIGGLPEAVAGLAASAIVEAANPTALANSILELQSNWAQVAELAVVDSRSAAVRFDPKRYRHEIVDELERVLLSEP